MSFILAGTRSGVGKTTLTMGVLASLSRKYQVQPFKVGPDYIDPAFHTKITGRACRNLDSYMLDEETVSYLYEKNTREAEMAVIEGVMGLYDGAEIDSDVGTTASIAKILKLPVVLVVDGSKIAGSIAAEVLGYTNFDDQVAFAGVIINRVNSAMHYDLLKRAIEYHTDLKVYGYLKKDLEITLPERHLGLMPTAELKTLEKYFDQVADLVEETVDMKGIEKLAGVTSQTIKAHAGEEKLMKQVDDFTGLKIGIAKDSAFHFYYEDVLSLIRALGVELVEFSPINDEVLPSFLDGLFIGGGFPEMFGPELEANKSFRKSLLIALQAGIPYDAECGGLMYLCDSLSDLEGHAYDMVGWFEGHSEMTNRLQHFGYASLSLDKDCIYGDKGETIKIHEFHRSKSQIDGELAFDLKKIRSGQVKKSWQGGYIKGNGVAAYAHKHYYSNLQFLEKFLKHCVQYKESRT